MHITEGIITGTKAVMYTTAGLGLVGCGVWRMKKFVNEFPYKKPLLGMGGARMKPVVVEKRSGVYDIVPRLILPIVITFDHRVLDGGDAQRFLRVLIEALEDPDVLMMTMT